MNLWRLFPLGTNRLLIRHFNASDISPVYVAWLNDTRLLSFSNQRFAKHDAASSQDYLASFDFKSSVFLALQDTKSREVVGTMTVFGSPPHSTADVGILIGTGHQGLGLGTEAWCAVVDLLLASGLRKVTAGTSELNVAMRHLMARGGLELEGRRLRQEVFDGVEADVLYFGRFA